jgi:hypothetical protein
VSVTAGTTYVASYFAPNGHYSVTPSGFSSAGVDSPPLHALSNTVTPDGVYAYGGSSTFPASSYNATNYWVDVTFAGGAPAAPGAPTGVSASPGNGQASVSWVAPSDGGSPITSYTVTPFVGGVAQAAVTVSGSPPATSVTVSGLTNGTSYTFTVSASNAVGTGPVSSASNLVTPSATPPVTIFGSASPVMVDSGDTSPVSVGVKFTSDVSGSVTGVRFYKAAANTGTHVGSLWTVSGTLLASATFSNESASGWQSVSFSSPVSVTAGTTYVASYFAPKGHYSSDQNVFAASGVDSPPLHALANTVTPDGVYAYGGSSTFPASSYNATNYWVDVIFQQ